MSSFFTLDLDTTGPIIQINAPSYSSRESNNIITVTGNEILSNFQDIYIVDSSGNTHNVTFSFDGSETFSGNVVFNGYPIGVATIYAQLKDDVGNLSNLASSHISIIASSYYSLFKLTMSEQSVTPQLTISNRTKAITNISSSKNISIQKRQETISEQKRLTIVSDTN